MNIYFITPFPESIKILIENNISNQGIKKKLIDVNIVNLRDFSDNEYKKIDDEPYGGGSGMVMRADILANSLLV